MKYWTKEESAQLVEIRQTNPTLSWKEVSATLDRNEDSCRKRYTRMISNGDILEPEKNELFDVPMPEKSWELDGDFVVVGDIHVPTTDYRFSLLPAKIAKKHLREKRLIIAGDVFNMEVFSLYPKIWKVPMFAQEKQAAGHLLKIWLEDFDEIYIMPGNHDRRIAKFTGGELGMEDLVGMVLAQDNDLLKEKTRIHVSEYGYCVVNTSSGKWRITHSKNYSINQLVVADQLAQKFQMNIISNHTHHLAKGMDRFKRYVVIENGGLFDESKMSYVMLDDTKSAGMKQGFTMLKEGCAYVFGKDKTFTDWDFWL